MTPKARGIRQPSGSPLLWRATLRQPDRRWVRTGLGPCKGPPLDRLRRSSGGGIQPFPLLAGEVTFAPFALFQVLEHSPPDLLRISHWWHLPPPRLRSRRVLRR